MNTIMDAVDVHVILALSLLLYLKHINVNGNITFFLLFQPSFLLSLFLSQKLLLFSDY